MTSLDLIYFPSLSLFFFYSDHVLLSDYTYISKYWVTAGAGLRRNPTDAKEAIFMFQEFYFRVFLEWLNPL